jgi:hypothetical protein
MSENSIHRTTLVPRAASQLAQVLTAGRQLGIAAQLKEDIDRDRLVGKFQASCRLKVKFYAAILS